MTILHEESEQKGRFYIKGESQDILAEMTYSRAGTDKIIIDHTLVSESLKGQGVGKKLVAASVEAARQQGFKIMPLCVFAKAIFDKNPDWQDVLF